MSSNINDYVRPTATSSRRDINKILSLIHDLTAATPEETGLQERILYTPHVKRRTSDIVVGGADWGLLEYRDKETFLWKKIIAPDIKTYPLTHVTTGTLSFPVSDTKFGGRCDFDGTNYITVSQHTRLDLTTSMTISGFFYIPATDAGDTTSQTLIEKLGEYALYIDPHATAPNQVRASLGLIGAVGNALLDEAGLPLLDEAGVALQDDGVEIPYEAVATITPDAWNHITMVFDGTDLKLYIETVLTTTTATVGTIGTNVLDLTIG